MKAQEPLDIEPSLHLIRYLNILGRTTKGKTTAKKEPLTQTLAATRQIIVVVRMVPLQAVPQVEMEVTTTIMGQATNSLTWEMKVMDMKVFVFHNIPSTHYPTLLVIPEKESTFFRI